MKNKIDKYIQDQRKKQEKKSKPFAENRETLNKMSDKLINPDYVDPMWKEVK